MGTLGLDGLATSTPHQYPLSTYMICKTHSTDEIYKLLNYRTGEDINVGCRFLCE